MSLFARYAKGLKIFNEKVGCYVMYRLCQNWLNLHDPSINRVKKPEMDYVLKPDYKTSKSLITTIISYD